MYLALVKCTDNGYHDPHEMELLCKKYAISFYMNYFVILDTNSCVGFHSFETQNFIHKIKFRNALNYSNYLIFWTEAF